MKTEDIRTHIYIAAIWRAVAKALAKKDDQDAIRAAELVEQQLLLTAKLYAQEHPHAS